jgi:hypothetical protein
MSALRAKLKGKVHSINPKGKRMTRCGWSLGNIVEDGEGEDPAIFEREGSHILVKMSLDLAGVSCHPCRWGRDSNARVKSY